VTAAMRNPALTSPDGPGNLLAAVRVASDPWVRKNARALGVVVVMLDEVYAASDVLHLHALWAKFEALLKREGRLELAEACFAFLPARARLDLLGYEDPDLFSH